MRSTIIINPIRDTTRPPPPVPPRPSRALVAEALAKSRANLQKTTIQLIPSINARYKPNLRPIPKPRQQIPSSKSTEDLTIEEPSRTIVYRSPSLRNKDEEKQEEKTEPIYGKIRALEETKFKSMSDITKEEEVINPEEGGSDSDYFSSLGNMDSNHQVFNNNRDSDKIVESKIQQSDWFEVGDNGKQVRYSSCQIIINESNHSNVVVTTPPATDYPVLPDALLSRIQQQYNNTFAMSSLQGLPPLPKSLSGFNLMEEGQQQQQQSGHGRNTNPFLQSTVTSPVSGPIVPPRVSVSPQLNNLSINGSADSRSNSGGRKLTTLDTQLAVLRREMCGLRQLDLSLLSQLWSLNESIQDFRQLLQEQEESGALSPPSPSPSPSSDGDDIDDFYSPPPIRFRPAPPPPPLRKTSNSSSATSSEYGTV